MTIMEVLSGSFKEGTRLYADLFWAMLSAPIVAILAVWRDRIRGNGGHGHDSLKNA
ncbi:hypothetical protein [Desulfovibrio sp.]|uniref:hypothetical protein n=1 Tax=Desulfovibrio sp. TaxID=885 RepID=UPI0025B9D3D7|nr:hypothetical protein [Desulfovibrio sp.]